MLNLPKLNIFNHDIFNSAYAQYYSYIEWVLIFNRQCCFISYLLQPHVQSLKITPFYKIILFGKIMPSIKSSFMPYNDVIGISFNTM